jgi:hypothetical protein
MPMDTPGYYAYPYTVTPVGGLLRGVTTCPSGIKRSLSWKILITIGSEMAVSRPRARSRLRKIRQNPSDLFHGRARNITAWARDFNSADLLHLLVTQPP